MKFKFYDLEGHGYVDVEEEEHHFLIEQWAGECIESCCKQKDWRRVLDGFWDSVKKVNVH